MKPPAATAAVARTTESSETHQAQKVSSAPRSTTVGTPLGVGMGSALPQLPLPTPRPAAFLIAPAPPATPPIQAPPATPPADEDGDAARRTNRSIGPGQVVCWQLALVAVGLATTGSRTLLAAVTFAAIVLIVLTATRLRGVWLYQWAAVLAAFGCRRRRVELPATSEGTLSLVGLFCGRTEVSTLTVRDQQFGLLSRPSGAGVALRLGSDAQQLLRPGLGTLLESAEEQPVAVAAQLVLHTGVRADLAVRAWLTVSARRTPEIATDEQVGQVLANTVRRIVRRFDRTHVEALPLDEAALLASVGALAHTNAGRGHLRERWSTWSAGAVLQVCLRLNGFARLRPPAGQALVEALLGTVTGSAQTLAVTVESPGRPGEPTRYDAVLRVAAAHPATLDSALTVLGTLARSYGVEPQRLDGRHATGVAATLPLGIPLP
jgi:ESX secretion system protein EccE